MTTAYARANVVLTELSISLNSRNTARSLAHAASIARFKQQKKKESLLLRLGPWVSCRCTLPAATCHLSKMASMDLEMPGFTKRSMEEEEAEETANGHGKKAKGGGKGGAKGSKSREGVDSELLLALANLTVENTLSLREAQCTFLDTVLMDVEEKPV